MRKPIKHILLSLIGSLILFNPVRTLSQNISYYLEIDEQKWNSFHVRVSVENMNQPQLVFVMPSWRPGAYIRRDFGVHVKNIEAFGELAEPLSITRLNQSAWRVEANNSAIVRVEYDIDHSTPGLIGKRLNSKFAMVDGAMNFMYINGKKNLPTTVHYRVPHGWKLATALPAAQGSFEYMANNYDHLIDSPAFMSRFKDYYFTIKNQ